MDEETAILTHLSKGSPIDDSYPWASEQGLDHAKVIGSIKSLESDGYVVSENLSTSFFEFSDEARDILQNGSQEILVLKAINEKEEGKMSMPELQEAVGKDTAKIGMGNCMKSKWIKKDGGDLVALKKMDEVTDEVQLNLKAIESGNYKIDSIDDKVRSYFY